MLCLNYEQRTDKIIYHMTRFFEQYTKLCKELGKSANGVAKEIGLPSSSVTYWKRGSLPRSETLERIAAYFGVSVDYLQGYTDVKEKPTVGTVSFEDVIKAVKSMDREQLVQLAIVVAQEQGER